MIAIIVALLSVGVAFLFFVYNSNRKVAKPTTSMAKEENNNNNVNDLKKKKTTTTTSEIVTTKNRDNATPSDEGCCQGEDGKECACMNDGSSKTTDACCGSQDSEGVNGGACCSTTKSVTVASKAMRKSCLLLYGTIAGTSKRFATDFGKRLKRTFPELDVSVVDIENYEPDCLLTESGFVIVIVATYTEGLPPPSTTKFYEWLTWEADSNQKSSLRKIEFAVFGLGNSVYEKSFNVVGRTIDKCFFVLGATRLHRRGIGDESVNILQQFDEWCDGAIGKIAASLGPHVVRRLKMKQAASASRSNSTSNASSRASSSSASTTTRAQMMEKIDVDCGEADSESESEQTEPVGDVEDMGNGLDGEVDQRTTEQLLAIPNEQRREMVSDLQRRTLQKQGYQLIGSHSAVKMCRWTKAQLRGRGGCCISLLYPSLLAFFCFF